MLKGTTFFVTALAVNGMIWIGSARAEEPKARPDADTSQSGGQTVGEKADDSMNRAADHAGDTERVDRDKARPDADASQSGGETLGDTARAASATTQPAAMRDLDAKGIRAVLAQVTEAAMTRDGFDDLIERLAKPDRDRIGDYAEKKFDDLNSQIATFRQSWKDKYREDFNIKNDEMVFDEQTFRIDGGMQDSARAAGAKIEAGERSGAEVRSDKSDQSTDRAGVASSGGNKAADRDADRTDRDGDARAARGDTGAQDDLATVSVARSHGLPELNVRLIHENPLAWKIDVPDSIDGQRLHANLLRELTAINQHKADWPSDKNDAYQLVSHHVLMAIEDRPAGTSGKQD